MDQPLCIDVGPYETVFAKGTQTWSMPLGAAGVHEQFLVSDPVRPEELSAALSVIELHIDDLQRERPDWFVAQDVVEASGELVRHFAAIEAGTGQPLESFVGSKLMVKDVEEVFRIIATQSTVERLDNPGLEASSNDVIVGATCLWVEAARQLGWEQIVVAQESK